ncbi:DUF4397 domain-containing protein [Paraflavitalea pollutisoli]|uniref:DUF4397 domain-containing protein n=1 Tax=Paraflavitalea pollutisoli TaxID=3034143 RepID=UPI0023EB6B04|nr:DUF4397 domain-containing protein [Paraflavitalea sp. H1-2-19X]
MKKLSIFIVLAATLVACKKEYKSIYSFEDKTNKAKVKFVHALVNAYPLPDTAAQAGLQLYLNGEKLTGATNVTYGTGVFPSLEYTMVPAGDNKLKVVIPVGAKNAEIPVFEGPLVLEDQQTYTAFITDSLPNSSIFLIKENFSQFADSGKYFVRVINLMPNAAIDLYGTTDQTMIATNIAYKGSTEFIQVNVGTGARAFQARMVGTNLTATASITPVAGRMYTIFSYGVAGKGGTRAPKLGFYTSRFQTYQF